MGESVEFDGKTLCGSFDTASGKSPFHSVSAWGCFCVLREDFHQLANNRTRSRQSKS